MQRIKKNIVTAITQIELISIKIVGFNPRIGSGLPETIPLVILTMCVSGRIAIAMPWMLEGKEGEVRGKKVPARKSIGVKKRNEG
jgi:hypothetical protein